MEPHGRNVEEALGRSNGSTWVQSTRFTTRSSTFLASVCLPPAPSTVKAAGFSHARVCDTLVSIAMWDSLWVLDYMSVFMSIGRCKL